ncbi:MAG: ribbon-helix-helix domain-containing protein [Proteobacteria bacterium]|nr:ribbon-helix-helix domain-containing protein [Pseudomonadota bacterium]MDA1021970.1 ribbon-helix-helix domain-containing protein [Pseudomonadota bacterium]
MADFKIRKRSVLIAGHATSVSLEEAFWEALKEITEAKGLSLNALITEIDAARADDTPANLSSAIRVYVLSNTSNS